MSKNEVIRQVDIGEIWRIGEQKKAARMEKENKMLVQRVNRLESEKIKKKGASPRKYILGLAFSALVMGCAGYFMGMRGQKDYLLEKPAQNVEYSQPSSETALNKGEENETEITGMQTDDGVISDEEVNNNDERNMNLIPQIYYDDKKSLDLQITAQQAQPAKKTDLAVVYGKEEEDKTKNNLTTSALRGQEKIKKSSANKKASPEENDLDRRVNAAINEFNKTINKGNSCATFKHLKSISDLSQRFPDYYEWVSFSEAECMLEKNNADYNQIIKNLKRALNGKNSFLRAAAYYDLGVIYTTRDNKLSIKYLEMAKKEGAQFPATIMLYDYGMGMVYLYLNDDDNAVKCFQRVIGSINDGIIDSKVGSIIKAQSYNSIGIAYTKKRKKEEAIEAFEKALEIMPGYCTFAENLSKVSKKRAQNQYTYYDNNSNVIREGPRPNPNLEIKELSIRDIERHGMKSCHKYETPFVYENEYVKTGFHWRW